MPNAARPLSLRLVLPILAAALGACGGSGPSSAGDAVAGPGPALAAPEGTMASAVTSVWSGVAVSPRVRDLPVVTSPRGQRVVPNRRLPVPKLAATASAPSVAPEAPTQAPAPLGQVPAPSVSFEGIGEGFHGFVVDGAPADPNGDVGPTQYVQAVNVAFAVFDKSGTLLSGPTQLNQLWASWTSSSDPIQRLCASQNQGDPVVLYDRAADRWFLTQFAFALDSNNNPVAPFAQCVAVSTSGDATGSYNLYAFGPMTWNGADAFNDYGKFGVWSDAYYATYNMFGASFLGTKACAMDRASMIAGSPATQVCFQISGVGGTLPASLTGATPPPAGSPGLVVAFDWNSRAALDLWRMHVSFADPSSSSLTGPVAVPIPAFSWACPSLSSSFECAVQPDTPTLLDTVGDRLLPHLVYRNTGGAESLLAAHTVDEDGAPGTDQTGVRWYELRNAPGATIGTGSPVLWQSGIVPGGDGSFRFNPSLGMDLAGDIAVGYTLSGSTTYPSLAASGRLAGDPAGTFGQSERVLFAGLGSQGATSRGPLTRWGDYSGMSVDPVDDCTFWYTNQYLPAGVGTYDWHTRVTAFWFPSCAAGNAFHVTAGAASPPSCAVPVDVEAVDGSGTLLSSFAGQATVTTNDPLATATPAVVTFSGGVAHASVTFRTAGVHTVTVRDVANISTYGTADAPAGTAASLVVGAPSRWTAGSPQTVTITAVDGCGTAAPSWTGAAAVSTSDPQGSVEAPSAFAGGVATAAVTLKTAGAQTVRAATTTPAALSGSATTTVVAAPAVGFLVQGPASAHRGDAVAFSFRARDTYGNVTTVYSGTVVLTTTDAGATLPSPVAVQGGGGSASVTFATTGTQTVTAADQSRSSFQGSTTLDVTDPKKSGCGCGTGSTAGWAALLPLAALFAPRRRRSVGR